MKLNSSSDKLVLQGGNIYPFDGSRRLIENGSVIISKGKLEKIETNLNQIPNSGRTINCRGCLILPGFINTHTHLAEYLFKGLMDEVEFEELFYSVLFPWESKLDPDLVYSASLAAGMDAIRCGVTTVADMYHHSDSTARALTKIGLRGYLGQKILGFPPDDPVESEGAESLNFSEQDFEEQLDESLNFALSWQGDSSSLVTTALAPHGTNTLTESMLKQVANQADRHDLGLHLHLAQTESELEQVKSRYGTSCVELLDRVGILDLPTLGAHALFIEEGDYEILQDSKLSVSHNPYPNAKDAGLVAPVSRLIEEGVTMGLGTDSFQMNLLETARLAVSIHRIQNRKPDYLPAHDALAMATIEGAKAIGQEDQIGSLIPGKGADLVVFDLSNVNTQPNFKPLKNLLYYGDTSNVKTVVIDGKIVYRDGDFAKIDPVRVKEDFHQASSEFLDRLSLD